MLRSERTRHTYPFCWRCDSPLLYYAKPSWYIRTTAQRDRLLEGNARINWQPDHIKRGRFGNWLENNVDWAVSRERYWGTPLPFWVCGECAKVTVIGSREELADRAVDRTAAEALEDLHRPYIDAIALRCDADGCGGEMRRVPEVADAWFDSGAMPYAQWHYPFENQDEFDRQFPARLHLRGDRPDARLVLHLARRGGPPERLRGRARGDQLPQRHLPRPHPRRAGRQDVEEPRQRARSLRAAGPARRRRRALVHLRVPPLSARRAASACVS